MYVMKPTKVAVSVLPVISNRKCNSFLSKGDRVRSKVREKNKTSNVQSKTNEKRARVSGDKTNALNTTQRRWVRGSTGGFFRWERRMQERQEE